ncbi:hypothetical protein D9758_013268 [Tetrapyrgos nigripes]|uniref:F-box domain-containing protein n=1 Tax=Tetrapyrgos nigripes TaxID=182062 RepID=A0A8H5CNW0_9AGAR|nr:hypothetical protein D9758_013268 [Tetrapyrgos nigripes]
MSGDWPNKNLRNHLRNSFGVPSHNLDVPKLVQDASERLQECESAMKLTRALIEEQQAKLAELACHKHELLLAIQGYKSLEAPIRRLPPEILQDIFSFVCSSEGNILLVKSDEEEEDEIDEEFFTRIPPLRLSHVCSAWRDLTLSTSRLWSTIEVILDDWNTPSIFELLLQNSHSAPLILTLRMDHGVRWWSKSDPGMKALKCFTSHCSRWHHVTLQLHSSVYRHPDFYHIQGNLPTLETLCILTLGRVQIPHMPREPDPDISDLFLDAPRLQDFSTNLSDLRLIRLPGQQLTKISLTGLSHHTAEILSRCLFFCPNLEMLDLETAEREEEINMGLAEIFAENIETLCLRMTRPSRSRAAGVRDAANRWDELGRNNAIARLAFQLLTLPRLQKLQMTGYSEYRHSDWSYPDPDCFHPFAMFPDGDGDGDQDQDTTGNGTNGVQGNGAQPSPTATVKSRRQGDLELLSSFLTRSQCTITSLHLLGLEGPTDRDIIALLPLLPSLEVLEIQERLMSSDYYAFGGSGTEIIITRNFLRSLRRDLDGGDVDESPECVTEASSRPLSPSSFPNFSWDFLPKLTVLKLSVNPQHLEEMNEELGLLSLYGNRVRRTDAHSGNGLIGPPSGSLSEYAYLTTVELYENFNVPGYEPTLRTKMYF